MNLCQSHKDSENSHISVRYDTTESEWNQFALASTSATYCQLGQWKGIISDTFGHRAYYLSAIDHENNVQGLLPLFHMKSRIFGNFLISIPYLNYGGAIFNSEQALQVLISKAAELGQSLDVDFVQLRHHFPIDLELPVKSHKVSMRLDLPEENDLLFGSFPSKLRSQIKKPLKEGFICRIGKEDELDNFYHVFSRNMRDLGTPVLPIRFFSNILKYFPNDSRIVTIYKEEVPVASGFLIGFREVLEIPWASALRAYNRFSVNMLLYWKCLKFACDNGYHTFDFGRSSPDSGTYRFKRQWGAEPVELYWHHILLKSENVPEIDPSNPKYRLVIQAWKRLPLTLANIIGPQIVKYIP